MKQLFIIAIRNIIQHRKRSFMLGGAIAGVTALLIFLLSLSSGVNNAMFEAATTIQTGHINVGGFYKITSRTSTPVVTDYKKVVEVIQKSVPDVEYVVLRGRGYARIISDTGSLQSGLTGLDIHNEPFIKKVIQVESGNLEDLSKPNSILLFKEQARKLNVKIGDSMVISAMTSNSINNTVDAHVVAIAKDVGLFSMMSVFVPYHVINDLYQINDEQMGVLFLYIKDMKNLSKDMDILRKSLTAAGYALMDNDPRMFWLKVDAVNREQWTGQKLDVNTWEGEISFIKWTITAIDGITYMLISILLFIIVIGIMNSMWISIRERTREIGTLRAMGMQRSRVMWMFIIEAFTLSGISTLVGATIGLTLAGILHLSHIHVPTGAQMFLMANTLRFSFDIVRVFGGMCVIVGVTTLISIIPSLRAARLKPITAMQHNG